MRRSKANFSYHAVLQGKHAQFASLVGSNQQLQREHNFKSQAYECPEWV